MCLYTVVEMRQQQDVKTSRATTHLKVCVRALSSGRAVGSDGTERAPEMDVGEQGTRREQQGSLRPNK